MLKAISLAKQPMSQAQQGVRVWRRTQYLTGAFLSVAALIIGSTALFKIVTIFGNSGYLESAAPVFPEMSWRQLLLLAALAETFCATWIVRRWGRADSIFVVLWLAVVFLAFRSISWLQGYEGSCHCFGFLGDWTGLSEASLNSAAWVTLMVLLLGSGALLLLNRSHLLPAQ